MQAKDSKWITYRDLVQRNRKSFVKIEKIEGTLFERVWHIHETRRTSYRSEGQQKYTKASDISLQ